MRLFLASEAKHPDTIKKLEEYIGGFKGKSIAYIPTAANAEEGMGVWKQGGTWQLVQNLGAKVDLIQLEDYRDNSYLELIKNKDIAWFAGGFPGYLMYWIRLRSLDLYLKEFLGNGKLFVGSSAGAMVAGETLSAAEWGFDDNENERGANDIKPLGLVDFDIYPHYEDALYEKIKENYKGRKLYLLKNGEEMVVEDGGSTSNDKITVIGEERIISK